MLLDVLLPRPKYGLEYEREAEDVFGIVLCAVIVGWPELLVGGRGTDRGIGDAADGFADLPAESDPALCGGRGTERPAGCGMDLALLDAPSGPRLADGAAVLRAVPGFCEAVDLEKLAGGLILLTVGREVTPADGLAAGWPAFDPSTLARVGETSGLPILALDNPRIALGEILAAFPRTERPCSKVFRETAVRPPVVA
jgi:hypothetical protein